MKIPEHIAIITKQIEAMRKDGHDDNTRISIQLDAMEYAKDAIVIANQKFPDTYPENFVNN